MVLLSLYQSSHKLHKIISTSSPKNTKFM